MRTVIITGRQPFGPTDPAVTGLAARLRGEGQEVEVFWLPAGVGEPDRDRALLAAALLHVAGADQVIAHGFPAEFVPGAVPFDQGVPGGMTAALP